MLSLVSKQLFALSVAGVVAAIAYGLAVDERSGVALFLFLSIAAAAAGGAMSGNSVPDLAPVIPADAPPPEPRATTIGAAPRGSTWPLLAAVAITILFAGAAAGLEMVFGGAIAVAAATGGWFSRVWSEDPTWSPRVRERVSARLLVPVGLPIATFLLAAFIAIALSRVLLAVSKNAAALFAVVVGVAVMAACAWVAARPRLRPAIIVSMAALAATATLGAGIAGGVSGERHFEAHGGHEEGVVKIVAKEVAFDKKTISAPAGEKLIIEFENHDEVYHNVAIYKGEGSRAKPIFNGEGFTGEADREYEITVPPPGEYVFVCDFHVNMTGTFVSEPT